MKLSVVIPVYNAEPYLRQCLDLVLAQDIREIEVLCVDDGSTDGCAVILAEYAAKDARIRVLTQGNSGQGAARNRGLELATGDYVYFMDADDELAASDALSRLVAAMDRDRLDVLLFDAETRFDADVACAEGAPLADAYIRRHDYVRVRTGQELFVEMLRQRELAVMPCLMIIRRAFIDAHRLRFPDERIFYEDNIFMTRVMLAAERASHRPWRLYLRKVHAGSTVTSTPTMRHLRGYLACYRDICGILSRGGWNSRTRKALLNRRRSYKLNVRHMADDNARLVVAANDEMTAEEYVAFREVLVYPLCEKVENAFHCLCERGVVFTLKRILLGRQR